MTIGDGRTAICTWFVADRPGEETVFPQIPGGRSSSPAFQAVYWRCIVAFFATSARRNPGRRHFLFTNAEAPVIDGVEIGATLRDLGVETIALPITRRLPAGAYGRFGNQFYILDIIRRVAEMPVSRVIVLDSDCVWLRRADALERAIDRCGVLAYDLGYPLSQIENGVRIGELGVLGATLGLPPRRPTPVYAGGEIFAATGEACRELAPLIDRLWDANSRAIAQGEPRLNEEAQFLSILHLHRGIAMDTANPFIRRIWTAFRHSTTRPDDLGLAVWHLPAEKTTGFRRLFDEILDPGSAFSADRGEAADRALLAALFGVPRRSPQKLIADLAQKLDQKARNFATATMRRRAS